MRMLLTTALPANADKDADELVLLWEREGLAAVEVKLKELAKDYSAKDYDLLRTAARIRYMSKNSPAHAA